MQLTEQGLVQTSVTSTWVVRGLRRGEGAMSLGDGNFSGPLKPYGAPVVLADYH